ncbi:MAG TPA: HD domain-containing protein [Thermoanaerobaculia bacterium]|nr:HD domain-containing protein [Thermoanaerobaculia bacterium]HUM29572.1 HD domain-containing protein [Thermoanaerobaculia bacterium]HXK67955.1 HD domain-containing protein [Thermoanaerobaculia bacterium]
MAKALDIRDPVHGYIRLTPLEASILDTPEFQRLRFVSQLGLTNLVFPGATHTRFSHALGVMHLAGRLFDHLIHQSPETLLPPPGERERLRHLIRITALLHDIGHSPFSHALESLFPEGMNHERMAVRIIQNSAISEVIREAGSVIGITIEDIVNLMTGHLPPEQIFLFQSLNGELDVDKMDYLLRDSLFCGVGYGHYDLERLLYTITLLPGPEGPRIGVLDGGIHALEAFVLARYYMFTQVYFDATSKIIEKHLEQFFSTRSFQWPMEPSRFIETDDTDILSQLRASSTDPHARRVLQRNHYPITYETDEHLDEVQEQRFVSILSSVQEALPAGSLFCSNATKDPHHFSQAKVMVLRWDGSLQDVTERSSFIGQLKRINQYRIYAREDLREDIQHRFMTALKDGV